ncbi:ABC transporter permease [Arcanobacterium ihumii]|uniref:ABC transporter permease n=1 Tax=Arcanobacterium ihumii TaxID=2138162 RepID=UPI000F52D088|nr:ABC transporter permease [Arcanobacterium ihumii]
MKTFNKISRNLIGFLSVGIFICLWQFSCSHGFFDPKILPSPFDLMTRTYELLANANFAFDFLVTVIEILLGVLIGSATALFTAFVFFRSKMIERLSMPLILIAQITPKIALAPLFVLWFGLGLASKVWLVALVTFFPVLVNCLTGLRSISPAMFELSKILEFNRFQRIIKIELPSIRSHLSTGIRLGSLAGVTAAVIGEMIGARAGLGYVVIRGQETADISQSLVSIFMLGFLGLLFWLGFQKVAQKTK